MSYRRLLGALSVGTLLLAACGGDDDETSSDSTAVESSDTTAAEAEIGTTTATDAEATTTESGDSDTTVGESAADLPLAGTVKIGGITSQSGNYAVVGVPMQIALEEAVRELNEAGGVVVGDERYEFELVIADDQSDTGAAVAAATGLTQDEGVQFLFGPTISGLAPSVAQLVLPSGVIMFSPATALAELLTPEAVEGPSKTLFNTKWSAARQGTVDAAAIKLAYPDAATVALVFPDDGTGRTTGEAVQPKLEEAGLEVVALEYFPADATDFQTVLTTVRDTNPDVLWVCCGAASVSGLIRQAIELGFESSIFVSNSAFALFYGGATGSPLPVAAAMDFQPVGLEGLPDGTLFASRPSVEQYASSLTEQGIEIPPAAGIGFYYYDYVGMLAAAMEEAGTVTDTAAIAEALESITYEGLNGPITFLSDHSPDVEGDVCLYAPGETGFECLVIPPPGE